MKRNDCNRASFNSLLLSKHRPVAVMNDEDVERVVGNSPPAISASDNTGTCNGEEDDETPVDFTVASEAFGEFAELTKLTSSVSELASNLANMEKRTVPLSALCVQSSAELKNEYKYALLWKSFTEWYRPSTELEHPSNLIVVREGDDGKLVVVEGQTRIAIQQQVLTRCTSFRSDELKSAHRGPTDVVPTDVDLEMYRWMQQVRPDHENVTVHVLRVNDTVEDLLLLPLVPAHNAAKKNKLSVLDAICLARSIYDRFVQKRSAKPRKNNTMRMAGSGNVVISYVFTNVGIPTTVTSQILAGVRAMILLREEVFNIVVDLIRKVMNGHMFYWDDSDNETVAQISIGRDDSPVRDGGLGTSVVFWDRVPQLIHRWSCTIALWKYIKLYIFSSAAISLHRMIQEAHIFETITRLPDKNICCAYRVQAARASTLPSNYLRQYTYKTKNRKLNRKGSTQAELISYLDEQIAKQSKGSTTPTSVGSESLAAAVTPNTPRPNKRKEVTTPVAVQLKQIRLDDNNELEPIIGSATQMRTERLDPQDCAENSHKPVLIMVDYSVYGNAHMDGARAMLDIFERSRKIVEKFGFIHSETLICSWLTLEQTKAPLLEGLFRHYISLLIYEKRDNKDFSTFADDLYRTEIVAFMCVPYRHLASLFKVDCGTVPTKPYSKTLELLVSKMNSLLIHSRGNMSIGFVLRFLTYKERDFRTIYSDELSSIKYRHLCTVPAPFQQIKEVEDRMKKNKGIDNNATV